MKTIALAADHRGFELKEKIKSFLKSKRIRVIDYGTHSEESCDYPDYILRAAEAVKKGKAERAFGICHSGIGSTIAANKVPGVRAALCQNAEQAQLSRQHNDANMLILGSHYVPPEALIHLVETWLTTPFEGGRHDRRVD